MAIFTTNRSAFNRYIAFSCFYSFKNQLSREEKVCPHDQPTEANLIFFSSILSGFLRTKIEFIQHLQYTVLYEYGIYTMEISTLTRTLAII